MRVHSPLSLLCCLAALASVPALGATVTVSFVDAVHFSDAGTSPTNEEANLQALARHLQTLGQARLPADQVLRVEVLDVDLAGTVRPSRRGAGLVRTVRGGADAPHIRLHYTLEVNGQATRQGDESLSDLGYLHGFAGVQASDPLIHEKRLLDTWFKARFVDPRAAAD